MRGERGRSGLTPREREVLDLVRVGLTNEEIAGQLVISPDTAKYHVSQILAKLGVASREEAAALPEERTLPWWAHALAWSAAAKAAVVAAMLAVVIGLGVMAWAVLATGSGGLQDVLVNATPTATPSGPTAVPWVDSTPGPTMSPSPSPTMDPADADVSPCRATDLAAAYVGDNGAGGMNLIYLNFANVSASRCRLQGSPQIAFLDSSGTPIQWDQYHCGDTSRAPCPPTDVILPPGIPTPAYHVPIPGQANLTLIHDRCDAPASQCKCVSNVAAFGIELPDGGGSQVVVQNASPLAFCSAVSVGEFAPVPTASPRFVKAAYVRLILPQSVAAGSTLDFQVAVNNLTSTAYKFDDPCPNFGMFIYDLNISERQSLNCRPAGPIPSGGTVSFDMQIQIPASAALGSHYIDWWCDGVGGAEDASPIGKTPYQFTVVAPSP